MQNHQDDRYRLGTGTIDAADRPVIAISLCRHAYRPVMLPAGVYARGSDMPESKSLLERPNTLGGPWTGVECRG